MRSDATALVSIIVPIYNAETYLDQCLNSLSVQTHDAIEIICVNDGSPDSSSDIIRAHAEHDPRIRVVEKTNAGYGAACNTGLELACGEWISIVEPDDWVNPTAYEDVLTFVASFDEAVDIVKTPWTEICDWDDPEKQFTRPSNLTRRVKTSKKPFVIGENRIIMELHPSIWSAIYRRSFLEDHDIRFIEYPGSGWADNPFLVETLCQAQSIVYLDKPFYNYRCDLPGSTLNHATDALVSRPFDRWETMMDVIERLGVTDERVIMAHYIRGFNYVNGAIYDDGWDNPVVQKRTREVFARMDPELVARIPELAPHRKELYFDVLGMECPKFSRWPWAKHLVNEAWFTLKTQGPLSVLRRIPRALKSQERSRA